MVGHVRERPDYISLFIGHIMPPPQVCWSQVSRLPSKFAHPAKKDFVKPSCCLNSLLLWDKITGASSLSVDSCHHVWTPPTTCGVLKNRIPSHVEFLRMEFHHVWSSSTMCGILPPCVEVFPGLVACMGWFMSLWLRNSQHWIANTYVTPSSFSG